MADTKTRRGLGPLCPKDDEDNKLDLELEMPPSPEAPGDAMSELFETEGVPRLASKVMVLENLLNLVTRDCSYEDFSRELLICMMKAIKCEAGSILEVNYEKKALFFRSVVGQSSDRVARFVVPIGQGIVGHVAESRLPLAVNNIEQNEMHLKSIETAVEFQSRNLIAVPIIIRGKVFGVLELLNRIGEDEFTEEDVELLTYLCEMAAKAIEMRLMLAWVSKRDKKQTA